MIDKRPLDRPLFSIITISFNNSNGLAKTLESIKIQKESDYELIVIDGGSIDDSIKVIEQYKDIISYSISEKDRGIAHAFNKGTKVARGKIVNYLNSGDIYLHENVLTIVKESYLKYHWEWAYGLRQREDISGNIYNARNGELMKYSFTDFSYSRLVIAHQAVFIELDIIVEANFYNEQYQFLAMDYDLLLKIGKKYIPNELDIYLILYEDFGLSAKQFYKNLYFKHIIRSENLNFTIIEKFQDLLRTYIVFIIGKVRSYLKLLLIKFTFGRKFLRIK